MFFPDEDLYDNASATLMRHSLRSLHCPRFLPFFWNKFKVQKSCRATKGKCPLDAFADIDNEHIRVVFNFLMGLILNPDWSVERRVVCRLYSGPIQPGPATFHSLDSPNLPN